MTKTKESKHYITLWQLFDAVHDMMRDGNNQVVNESLFKTYACNVFDVSITDAQARRLMKAWRKSKKNREGSDWWHLEKELSKRRYESNDLGWYTSKSK